MPIYKINSKRDGLQGYNVRINYVSDSGIKKQLTRTVYGAEQAKDLERRLNSEIQQKEETSTKRMTVQQLFDEYMRIKEPEVKETTIAKNKSNFDYYILPTFKNIRIDRISAIMLQKWKLSMEEKGLSLNTKKQAFSDFRAMFNYAVRLEYLPKNPISKMGNFKDTKIIKEDMNYYTAQEFSKFINAAKAIAEEQRTKINNLSEWDFYVLFSIAFYTGLRKGEIYALKWSDINGDYLSVKRSVTQRLKGGDRETPPKNIASIRTLQMPLPLINILKEHKKRQMTLHNFTDNYRICGGERSVRDSTVQRRNEKYAQAAELKVIRIHDFRHSHVSVLANERINIQEVSRRLGHSRIEMTWNTYSHLYPREEERAISILNNIV